MNKMSKTQEEYIREVILPTLIKMGALSIDLMSLSVNDFKAQTEEFNGSIDKTGWYDNDDHPVTVGALMDQLSEFRPTDLIIYEDKDNNGNILDHHSFYLDPIDISSDEFPNLTEVQICRY